MKELDLNLWFKTLSIDELELLTSEFCSEYPNEDDYLDYVWSWWNGLTFSEKKEFYNVMN